MRLALAGLIGLCLVAGTARADNTSQQQQALLESHNKQREQHCAPPLVWASDVAKVAQRWADRLAAKGCMSLEHSDGNLGENLAAGTAGSLSPDAVVQMWYREVDHYSYKSGGFSMKTGHFTQLVWVGTKRLGCGSATCKNGFQVWVCNYDPPGNVEGAYRANVLPPACHK